MPSDNESEKRKIMPVTTSSRESIQNIALGVLEKNNIRKPPVIAADLARTLGFKVLCAKITPEYVAGFIDVDNREIVVNREDAPVKQNFTIAHELGHYLLDHYKNDDYKDNYSVLLRDTCEGEDTQMGEISRLYYQFDCSMRTRKNGRIERLTEYVQYLRLTTAVSTKIVDDSFLEIIVGWHPTKKPAGKEDMVNIEDVGCGVSQVLPILVALIAAKKSQIVYIE